MKNNFINLFIIFRSHTTLITFLNLYEITKTSYNLEHKIISFKKKMNNEQT